MKSLLLIAIGSALVNNVVLASSLVYVLSLEFLRKLRQQPEWVQPFSSLLLSHQQLQI